MPHKLFYCFLLQHLKGGEQGMDHMLWWRLGVQCDPRTSREVPSAYAPFTWRCCT